ncbi:MAG: DUF4198 domain-containing protein [Longimicrobiales bacterium]
MTRILALSAALAAVAVTGVFAHDLFLKLGSYHVPPHSSVAVLVLNGTFSQSEGPVARDRIAHLTLLSPAGRVRLDTAALTPGDTSVLALRTGEPGTYVIGLSTLPRRIDLAADDFNQYLALDGIPDLLIERAAKKQLGQPARERYSKHVKALLQVGNDRSDSFGAVLGYPAELVPLENPYALSLGGVLRVRALVKGEPVANQLLLAGGETAAGEPITEQSVRTDPQGTARFTLDQPGRWYIKFIHMAPARTEDLDYESTWATLTFEVR